MNKKSHISLPIAIQKEHLNRMLAQKMPKIQLRDNLSINRITIDGQGGLFEVDLYTEGLYNGVLSIVFKPRFDKDTKLLILDEMQLEMKEKGLLSKGLNWMMKGFMQDKIEDKIQSQLDQKIQELVQSHLNKLQKIPLPEGILLELQVMNFDIVDILFEGSELKLIVDIEGEVQLKSQAIKGA